MPKDPFELLDPNTALDAKLENMFLKKKEPFATLLVVQKELYEQSYLRLVKTLSKKQKIVYVSLNKESGEIIAELTEAGIDASNLIFVDAVANLVDRSTKPQKNVMLVENPSEVSEIGDELEKAMKREKNGTVIIDSLNTLLVYNDAETVEKFLHTAAQKIRKQKFNQVLLAVETKDEKLLATVSQFFDEIAVLK